MDLAIFGIKDKERRGFGTEEDDIISIEIRTVENDISDTHGMRL